jgi:hypothetical protein
MHFILIFKNFVIAIQKLSEKAFFFFENAEMLNRVPFGTFEEKEKQK